MAGNDHGLQGTLYCGLIRLHILHPIGTKARLASALSLFTGRRPSGVVRFGRQVWKPR
jgi:hypothetical protein